MILHLVTDRCRLASGTGAVSCDACLLSQVRYAVSAGIDVIQVRERDLDGRALAGLVRAILAATTASRTRVVVNERVDVALATGADGVHLRGDSLATASVRAAVPPRFLIGRSVHSEDDAASAGPADYVIAGTVWATPSKPDGHAVIGPEGLARIVQVSRVPVLAIGGVDPVRVPALASAGAAGVAAIGTWMGDPGPCRAIPLGPRVQAFREAGLAANMRTFPLTG